MSQIGHCRPGGAPFCGGLQQAQQPGPVCVCVNAGQYGPECARGDGQRRQSRDFLRRHLRGRIVFLELGVGNNTPGIIKYPFWRMTADNSSAWHICVNQGQAWAPEAIRTQSVCLDGDIGTVLEKMGGG